MPTTRQFVIRVKQSRFIQRSDTRFEGRAARPELTRLHDVSVEVDARLRSGDAVFGLICRYNGFNGPHYIGVIDDDGAAWLYKSDDRG